MRYIILIMTMLLAFGCIEIPVSQGPGPEEQAPEKVCRTVHEEVPTEMEECGEVSYTEEVCEKRTLNYSINKPPIIHLCQIDGDCGGKPLSECRTCAKAMTRCSIELTNEEENKAGTWSVSANFYVDDAIFKRDPVTKTVEPGETVQFDFQHFYVPGDPIDSATCQLDVVKEAVIDDCYDVTRTRTECSNVTKITIVQKEVCE